LHPNLSTKLPHTLLIMSIIFFIFIAPVLKRVQCGPARHLWDHAVTVLAIVLLAQQAARKGDTERMWLWLGSTLMFPFVTITLMGFASYGGAAAGTVWAMSYRFIETSHRSGSGTDADALQRPDFLHQLHAGTHRHPGASLGGSGLQARINSVQKILYNFEPLNLKSQLRMETIDGRLNQNDMVGKAVRYLQAGRVWVCRGWHSLHRCYRVDSRIIWPSKPNIGGSGGLVSRFTGQKFAESTSVGVGQVLEFYVNWGLTSVIIGFLLYGCLIQYLDQRAGEGLITGDLWMAVKWALPGLSLMQAGGSLAETIGSLAAGVVFIVLMHKFIFAKYYDDGPGTALGRQSSNRPVRGSKYPQSVG